MVSFRKISILLFIFCIFSCKKKELEIWKLKEPLQKEAVRFDYYVVKNYIYNDTSIIKELDAFAIKSLPKDLERYSSYILLFYKYNRRFIRKIEQPNELIEWYSERILVEYTWEKGKYCYKVIQKRDKTLYTDFTNIMK